MKVIWVQDVKTRDEARTIIIETYMDDKPDGSYYSIGVPRDKNYPYGFYFYDPTQPGILAFECSKGED